MPANTSPVPTISSFDTSTFDGTGAVSSDISVQTPTTPSPLLRTRDHTNTFNSTITIACFAPALFTLFYFAIPSRFPTCLNAGFVLSLTFIVILSYMLGHQQYQSVSSNQETTWLLDAARIKGEMDEAEIKRKDLQLQDMGQRLEAMKKRARAKEAKIKRLRTERGGAKVEAREGQEVGTPKGMPMFVFGAGK